MKLAKERKEYYDRAVLRRKSEDAGTKRAAAEMQTLAEELRARNANEAKEMRARLQSELLDVRETNKTLVG